MKQRFIILFCACAWLSCVQAQTAFDFRANHLELWQQADEYAREQSAAWQEIWSAFGVDSVLAQSVVFPEMVRFSKMQDRVETLAVRYRYVAEGSRLCDYSIGRFQMKPSFVEKLEKAWMESEYAAEYEAVFDTMQTKQARTERITRMEQELWQCIYLSMFIRLLYDHYSTLATYSKEQQVTYIATAYNRGCPLPGRGKGQMQYLQKRAGTRMFHTMVIAGKNTPRYVYSEIALFRYREWLQQSK